MHIHSVFGQERTCPRKHVYIRIIRKIMIIFITQCGGYFLLHFQCLSKEISTLLCRHVRSKLSHVHQSLCRDTPNINACTSVHLAGPLNDSHFHSPFSKISGKCLSAFAKPDYYCIVCFHINLCLTKCIKSTCLCFFSVSQNPFGTISYEYNRTGNNCSILDYKPPGAAK